MPKKRAAQFAAEVFGVLDTRFDGFLDGKLLEAARTRARVKTFAGLPSKTPTLWISIDPPSHTVSAMGMAAAIVSPTGAIVIIGAASVDCSSTHLHVPGQAISRNSALLRWAYLLAQRRRWVSTRRQDS